MTEKQRPDLEAAWRAMRRVSQHEGARERVRAALEAQARPPRRLGAWVLAGVSVTLVAGIGAAWWWKAKPKSEWVETNNVVHVTMPSAAVQVETGATYSVREETLRLRRGQVHVKGKLLIDAPGCKALVDGETTVRLIAARVIFATHSGRVEWLEPAVSCVTENVPASAQVTPVAPPEVTPPLPVPAPPRPRPHVAPPKEIVPAAPPPLPEEPELEAKIEAYRQALALRGKDDALALTLWKQMKQRWPESSLNHEIDLNVIDALLRLGKTDDARAAAREFLKAHPKSPRAPEIARIAEP